MAINLRIFFAFCSLVFFFTSYAQEPIYKHFGVDEGLPSSEIYDVYQDKEGYIWFATDKGLSRYNGYEFENFDINDGLPGNVVLRFYPQENGEIWCYTYENKGLFYFKEVFDGFRAYKHNKALINYLKLSLSVVKSVYLDEFKTLHIGGFNINGEITINDNGIVSKNFTDKNYFNNNNVKSIVVGNNPKKSGFYYTTSNKDILNKSFFKKTYTNTHLGAYWLINNKKVVFMDGNSIEIRCRNKPIKRVETQHQPIGIKVIDSTRFFVGYNYGGCKIINDKGEIEKEYLKGKPVTNFLIDHEGGLWFTTANSGVYYTDKHSIAVFQQLNKNAFSHVNSLVRKKDELLIGYKNGNFATIGKNRTFELKKTSSQSIPSLVEYDDMADKTYVYSNYNIEVDDKFEYDFYVTKLSEPSSDGNVFAVVNSGLYDIRSKRRFRLPFRVQDVCIWKNDTLLATTFGVLKKTNEDGIPLSKHSELLGFRSDDIDISKDGERIFIATQSAGVVVYGKEIYNISTNDGLVSNIINEIHVENSSTIWACTNKGLSRIVFKDKGYKITNISKKDGLLSNEVEDVEIINDTIWVGTIEGLCYLPKKVLDYSKKLDNIFFKIIEIKVNDVVFSVDKKPDLDYDENKITFLVQGISFAKNDDIKYLYRLKEVDSKWSTTKSRSITFPNLKSGSYTFEVRVCVDNDCYAEKQLEYKFTIHPPFWKSGWFYSLCVLALGGLLYVFFKVRVLTYNKDVTREFIRLLIKWLKRDEKYLKIRMNGENIKIPTDEILYVNSSGNYLDIVCLNKTYTIRCKIGDFIAKTPDALEYLRIHRSYIIRIDKVTGKSKNTVTIKEQIIPVGETYLNQLDKIQF